MGSCLVRGSRAPPCTPQLGHPINSALPGSNAEVHVYNNIIYASECYITATSFQSEFTSENFSRESKLVFFPLVLVLLVHPAAPLSSVPQGRQAGEGEPVHSVFPSSRINGSLSSFFCIEGVASVILTE